MLSLSPNNPTIDVDNELDQFLDIMRSNSNVELKELMWVYCIYVNFSTSYFSTELKTSVNIESENVKIASDCNEVYNLHSKDSKIPLVETFCKVQDEYHSLVANGKFASDDSIFFSKCEVLLKRRFLTWFGRDDAERSLILPKVVGKLFDFIKNSVKMKQKLIILTRGDRLSVNHCDDLDQLINIVRTYIWTWNFLRILNLT